MLFVGDADLDASCTTGNEKKTAEVSGTEACITDNETLTSFLNRS